MRAAGMWRFVLASNVCLGFATQAGVTGYKGIPWGTACGEAVKRMEAKGFVFNHKEKPGLRGAGSSPSQPHLFLSNLDRRASCSAENADLEILRARGDAVRYLERPVVSSRDFDGGDPPPLRYLVLAQTEDRALQTAYLACLSKQLAGDQLEKKRIQDGNSAAVE